MYCSLIKKRTDIIALFKAKYRITGNLLEVHPTGTNQKKSDVLMLFSNNYSLGVNIKAGKSNFNQVTRLWLERLVSELNLTSECTNAITKGIDNHRLKRSKIFIEPTDNELIKNEFVRKSKKIMELIFKGLNNDIVKILALFNRDKKIFYLYDINDVIKKLSRLPITFSKHGVVNFGRYITLQRKGGNGHHIIIDKSNPKHPGNQLQFKMKILTFMEQYSPIAELK